MTRGAAANAILDAGRSKKRSLPFPLCPVPHPRTLSRSLPSIYFSLFVSLLRSFPLASLRLFRGGLLFLFLSFSRASFFFFLASSLVLSCPHHPAATRRVVFPLSSLLMSRDRQMMIKKALVRVRTTPRRPRRSSFSIISSSSSSFSSSSSSSPFSISDNSSSSFPLSILSAAFRSPSSPMVAALSLFFRRLISARSFPLSSSVHLSLISPQNFFFSPLSFSCGYTFVACIMVRGECLRVTCSLFVTDSSRKDFTSATIIRRLWPIYDGKRESAVLVENIDRDASNKSSTQSSTRFFENHLFANVAI